MALLALCIVGLAGAKSHPTSSPADTSGEGWIWQNPLPQGNDLFDVLALSNQVVVAVGQSGSMLVSTNGGTNWRSTSLPVGLRADLRSIAFIDLLNGWCVGDSGVILVTTNGGMNWSPRYSSLGRTNLNSVHFVNRSFGWVAGDAGSVLRTSNGGTYWEVQSSRGTENLRVVNMLSSSFGLLGGELGTLRRTINGGVAWDSLNPPAGSLATVSDMEFKGFDGGWACDLSGSAYFSRDSGSIWQRRYPTPARVRLHKLDALSRLSAWFVGEKGTIVHSSDGGEGWSSRVPDSTIDLHGVSFSSERYGWVVGTRGTIMRSIDSGATWNTMNRGFGESLTSFAAVDSEYAWAVGNGGTILATTNGGDIWERQISGTTVPLLSISFIDRQNGIACGEIGTILRTTNGGEDWNLVPQVTLRDLQSVKMFDSTRATIVGNQGVVLRTTNGGANWLIALTPFPYNLTSHQYINADTIWACGDSAKLSGNIIRSDDGGENWSTNKLNQPAFALNALNFVNGRVGFAVGNNGRIFTTTDHGNTWRNRSISTTREFESIHFADENLGWIAGTDGAVLRSTNGGINWSELVSRTGHDLQSIFFLNSSTGWIVGEGGTIMKSYSGGGELIPPTPRAAIPHTTKLLQNSPNPFNSSTKLRFTLLESAPTRIIIYDILGRKIREIDLGYLLSGVYDSNNGNPQAPEWDGLDALGQSVPSGVYVYSLITPNAIVTQKMILIR